MTFDIAKNELISWLSETVDCDASEIDPSASLKDVGLDSLDTVHLIATIERIIRCDLPEQVIRQVESMNDIFDLIRSKLPTKA